MDYLNCYINLIDSRSNKPIVKELGYEIHHVIPKCMGGENSPHNLVKLTHREHYIGHKLLSKIFPEDKGIQYAFLCMLRDPLGRRNLHSRQVQSIKNTFRIFQSKNWKINNPMFTEKSKKLHSDRMKLSNPTRNDPACNRTAQPIEVQYKDGHKEIYTYAKELSNSKNIPYPTVKYMLKNNKGSPKHGILKLVRLEKIK